MNNKSKLSNPLNSLESINQSKLSEPLFKRKTIAIVGKGGVGKTTISALLVNRMVKYNCHPILVVDADPNTGLDIALGIEAEKTVGEIREETRKVVQNGEMVNVSKQELLELKINESLVETKYYDFIAMGRPEGPGCYCYANNVLKSALSRLRGQYPYVIIDNEAGLENLSRRLVPEVDIIILITDSSKQGLKTVRRLTALVNEMGIKYNKFALIVNKVRNNSLISDFTALKTKINANYFLELHEDAELRDLSETGESLMGISENNSTLQLIDNLLREMK
jgi:CO dehydrogenase maturation factor